jgi:hypothetical protein
MRIKISHGVFGWEGKERRSDRYGAIHLVPGPCIGTVVTQVTHDIEAFNALEGKRVRLTCKVIESRQSGHIGDVFLGIIPSQPDVGEEVDLGVGKFTTSMGYGNELEILLQPGDGRREFWMDPRKLYRLHDQTVDIFAEETTEEYSPKPNLKGDSDSDAAIDNGDGSFQVKTKTNEPMKVLPNVEDLGNGLFVVTPLGAGKPGDKYRIR